MIANLLIAGGGGRDFSTGDLWLMGLLIVMAIIFAGISGE